MSQSTVEQAPNDEPIYPTHHCFDDCADFMNELYESGAYSELAVYTIVHGIILAPPDGEPHAHAWIEKDGFVIGRGIYKGKSIWYKVKRADFVRDARVWDETRYTFKEAVRMSYTLGGSGPWVPEYLALCGSDESHVWKAGVAKPEDQRDG